MKKFIIALSLVISLFVSTLPSYAKNGSIYLKTEFVADQASSYTHSIVQLMICHDGKDDEPDIVKTCTGFHIGNNLIVTTAHGFMNNGKLASKAAYSYSFYFNNDQAKVVYINTELDVCILKYQSDFCEPKAVMMLKEKVVKDSVYYSIGFPQHKYLLIKGIYEDSVGIETISNGFKINNPDAYRFKNSDIDKETLLGLSGGIIVNEKGNLVAMAGYTTKGYLYGITTDTINTVLESYYANLEDPDYICEY